MLLGRILDGLEASGRLDDTLIIVTADHGVSFAPGQPIRGLGTDNAVDVMWTPLFIKTPRQTTPIIDERPVEAVDVIPTLLDLIGAEAPWELDGVSALGDPRDDTRTFIDWATSTVHPDEGISVEIDGAAAYTELLAATAPIPAGDLDLRVHQLGPFGSMVGLEAAPLIAGTSSHVVRLEAPGPRRTLDLTGGDVQAYVGGSAIGADPFDVAVIVNGVVAGTTRTVPNEDGMEFATVLPPTLLINGLNTIEIAEILTIDGDVRLLSATLLR
jgi:hypothetical protein